MNIFNKIIGPIDKFSLETRIFHTISIAIFFSGIIGYGVNAFVHLPVVSVYYSIVIIVIPLMLFYLSRFRGRIVLAKNIFVICAYFFATVFWFSNSGIDGVIVILFLSLLIWQLVFNDSFKYFWLVYNLLHFNVLLYVSYNYPHLVKSVYVNGFARFLDHGFTYTVAGFASFLVVKNLLSSYQLERSYASNKNRELALKNEELVKTVDELERVNRTKDKLFSVVSHDIRSFTGNILNFSYLLVEHDIDLNPEKDALFKQHIYKSSQNLSELLNNLLSWARIQMDSINPFIKECDLDAVVNSAFTMFKSEFIEKGVGVEININQGLKVLFDIDMLNCIIRNAFSNALKFSRRDDVLNVNAAFSEKYNMIVLSFEDSGIGIDQTVLDQIRLKNSFYSQTGTNKEKGTGLGLSIVQEFLELNKGFLEIDSEIGTGSKFSFYLPIIIDKPLLDE